MGQVLLFQLFLSLRNETQLSYLWKVSQTFIVIQSVPFTGLLGEELDMKKMTQHRMNVCLSSSDNMSLIWNLKRSMKNGSIKIYKTF